MHIEYTKRPEAINKKYNGRLGCYELVGVERREMAVVEAKETADLADIPQRSQTSEVDSLSLTHLALKIDSYVIAED